MTEMKKNYISPIIDVLDEEKEECFIATSTEVQFSDEPKRSDMKVVADGFSWDDYNIQ